MCLSVRYVHCRKVSLCALIVNSSGSHACIQKTAHMQFRCIGICNVFLSAYLFLMEAELMNPIGSALEFSDVL